MNLLMGELATINLLVIWLVIIGALATLRVVKNRLEF